MTELADLDPLRNLPRLTHLVLLDNPVTRKEVSPFSFLALFAWLLVKEETLKFTELPVLDHLEKSLRSVPRLPKSEGR